MVSSFTPPLICLILFLYSIILCCHASPERRHDSRDWKSSVSQFPLKYPEATRCEKDRLNVRITYGDGDGEIMAQTYKDLTRCHNTHTFALEIFQAGCVVSPYVDQRAFVFDANTRLPDIKSLKLSRYDWNYTRPSWNDRFLARQPRPSVELWREAMDWTKLEDLDIDLPPRIFLDTMKDQLTGLQSLAFRPQWGFWGDEETLCGFDSEVQEMRNAYVSFIAGLPPLRNLSISGTGELLEMEPMLLKHGHTLRSLALHEFEKDCAYQTGNRTWRRPTIAVEELGHLQSMAPNLDSLSLDLHREHGNWPTEEMNVLSTLDNLIDLTIHFSLEDPTRMTHANHCFSLSSPCLLPELMEPRLELGAARLMFRNLRQQQRSKRLRHLRLVAGDYARREGGGLRFVDYEPNEPVMYRCRVENNGTDFCMGPTGFSNSRTEDFFGAESYDD